MKYKDEQQFLKCGLSSGEPQDLSGVFSRPFHTKNTKRSFAFFTGLKFALCLKKKKERVKLVDLSVN